MTFWRSLITSKSSIRLTSSCPGCWLIASPPVAAPLLPRSGACLLAGGGLALIPFCNNGACDQSAALRDGHGDLWQAFLMAGNPGAYFGTELQRERLSHSWSLDDLAKETDISAAHLSRIENGRRPATEAVAIACDKAFPARNGWFHRYWSALQTWTETPAWFKPWQDYELQASTLRSWSPGVIDGLLQVESYAHAQIGLRPDV